MGIEPPNARTIYLYICFLIGGSSAVQSISVQSLLFSEVIKESIDLLVADSYLLPPPPVLCFVSTTAGSLGRKSLVMEAESLHFATAQCTY